MEAEAADIKAAAADLGRRAGELRRAAAGAAAAAEERAGRMLDLVNAARVDQVGGWLVGRLLERRDAFMRRIELAENV